MMMTQKEALKILKMGKNVFLTGAAGSGKTYILNEYIQFLKEYGVETAVTASTGIAATHLKGMTIHSWSGIGIKDSLSDHSLALLEQREYLWKRFEKTKVLIIDEISMLGATTLDCVDQVSKIFKRNNLPFGGMQVIFSGDFFQLPPIEKKKFDTHQEPTIFIDDEEISGTPFAFKSKSWLDSDLHTCYLSEQFRQEDNNLLNLLSEIREGNFSDESIEYLNQRITKDAHEDITKLSTHNVAVDNFNQKKLRAIDALEHTYKMTARGKANLVKTLKKSCLVPENLILKKGALVMFVKNNPLAGYVNGTVGEIIDFDNGYPVVECGSKRHIASPQSWSIEEGSKILAEVSQIPLKLAWSVTIHKSQGMTLDKAVIDLSNSFVGGQGYVALSRVKTLDGLFLRGFNRTALEVHSEVRDADKKFRLSSSKISNLSEKDFENKHQEFFRSVGAKKFKVLTNTGEKLSTYEITQKLLKQKKSLEEVANERNLKIGTILTHIERLLKDKSLMKKDILYLKPKNAEFDTMLQEIVKESNKLKEFRLTPVFKALNGKYSFEDIRFARVFC